MLAILATTFPFMWDKLLPLLINSITGNPILSGLLLMLIIFLLGQVLRFPLEVQLVSMFFGSFIILSAFINWFIPVAVLLVGIVIGMFFIYHFLSR